MSEGARQIETFLHSRLDTIVFGMDDVIHALVIGLIGGGHVLLEGAPGLGKTLVSNAFAHTIGGTFKRVQGTSDLMPSDLTGVHVFDRERSRFEFRPGPLFANVVLVDEVNRAGPKTQSALLEAMEERFVTVDGERFALPENFLIVATQNPREFEGTYPLPESQLDRFMISLSLDYPDRENEARIIRAYGLPGSSRLDADDFTPLAGTAVETARAGLETVHVADELIGYVLDIAAASRQSSSIALGLSSRAALALTRCARIEAALRGGEFVVPDDVKKVALPVMRHRLVLSPEALLDGVTPRQEIDRIFANVAVPRIGA